eukprot:g50100.t1
MPPRVPIFARFFHARRTRQSQGEVRAGKSGSPSTSLGQYNEFGELDTIHRELYSTVLFVLRVAFPVAWSADATPVGARRDLQVRNQLFRTRRHVWYISFPLAVSLGQLYQVYLFVCHALARGAAALLAAEVAGGELNWFDVFDVVRLLDECYVAPWPPGTVNRVYVARHGGLELVGEYLTTVVHPAPSWLRPNEGDVLPRINTVHWMYTLLQTLGRAADRLAGRHGLSDGDLALLRERYHLSVGQLGDWFEYFVPESSPSFCAALQAELECGLHFRPAKAFRLANGGVLVMSANQGGSRDCRVLTASVLWLTTLAENPDDTFTKDYGRSLLQSLAKLRVGLCTPDATGFQLVAGTEGLLAAIRALAQRLRPDCNDERVNGDLSSSGLLPTVPACVQPQRPAREPGASGGRRLAKGGDGASSRTDIWPVPDSWQTVGPKGQNLAVVRARRPSKGGHCVLALCSQALVCWSTYLQVQCSHQSSSHPGCKAADGGAKLMSWGVDVRGGLLQREDRYRSKARVRLEILCDLPAEACERVVCAAAGRVRFISRQPPLLGVSFSTPGATRQGACGGTSCCTPVPPSHYSPSCWAIAFCPHEPPTSGAAAPGATTTTTTAPPPEALLNLSVTTPCITYPLPLEYGAGRRLQQQQADTFGVAWGDVSTSVCTNGGAACDHLYTSAGSGAPNLRKLEYLAPIRGTDALRYVDNFVYLFDRAENLVCDLLDWDKPLSGPLNYLFYDAKVLNQPLYWNTSLAMADEEPTEEPAEEPQVEGDPEVEDIALSLADLPADLVGAKKGVKRGESSKVPYLIRPLLDTQTAHSEFSDVGTTYGGFLTHSAWLSDQFILFSDN